MSPDDELRAKLWSLSHSERLAMLTISILQDKANAPALAVFDILKMTKRLAQHLGHHDRIIIGERMRTAADELEREHQEMIVVDG